MMGLVILYVIFFILSYGVIIIITGFEYRDKQERWKQVRIAAIVAAIILIILIAIAYIEIVEWNDGICLDCGGYYKYIEAVGHRRGTSYIYQCDTCGNMIELNTLKNTTQ